MGRFLRIGSSELDLWLVLGLGLLGFMMRRYNSPVAPVLIAVVLGPMAETELRRALAVSEGDVSVLISSPFTITVYLLLGIAMAVTVVQHVRSRAGEKADTTAPAAPVDEEEAKVGV